MDQTKLYKAFRVSFIEQNRDLELPHQIEPHDSNQADRTQLPVDGPATRMAQHRGQAQAKLGLTHDQQENREHVSLNGSMFEPMTFDIKRALSLPDIRNIVAKRDGVLERFGPLFRNPARLTEWDYLDFLSIKHNHHWTGLERLGRRAADDMNNLRDTLTTLLDETLPLSERFNSAVSRLDGVGSATLTPILLVAYEDRYGVWNGTSESELRDRGLWPVFPRGATEGQKYEHINAVLLNLARDHGVDLWTLDALWWADRLERENTGHHKDLWFNAVWDMAHQAELTANQAYGQTVERIIKNKDLRLSKDALILHLNELLEETSHRCAISGLALQATGPDKQLRPSLDRIDSSGHYEVGNLQVVARFINFWKQAIPDAEFRRQLAMVRGE